MKQSTLNFAAAKRTASAGKPKITSTAAPKPKVALPVTKTTSKRRESSGDDIDDYDDIILKEYSSEEIEESEAVDSRPSSVDAAEVSKSKDVSSVEDDETLTRKTRLQTRKSLLSATKPGKEKGSNVEITSQPFKPSNLKPEDLQKRVEANKTDSETHAELDPTSKKWNNLHKAAKSKLGGVPIHGKGSNKAQDILRVFDNSYEYGPCVGMTRLERWERAESLGLNPPKEVYEILMTKQGQTLDEYKESVFHGQV